MLLLAFSCFWPFLTFLSSLPPQKRRDRRHRRRHHPNGGGGGDSSSEDGDVVSLREKLQPMGLTLRQIPGDG